MRGLLGIVVVLAIALALSEARGAIRWRVVLGGVLLQAAIAALFLKVPLAVALLVVLDRAVGTLQTATEAGTGLVFGYLGGGPLPFAETVPGGSFILAFRALPLVLVISALAALLSHWGLLQRIVGALAWVLRRTLGIGGAVGLAAAAHIFVGMIEAPLLIKPYLKGMSRGELFAVMSCGMAGIAGTMMVIYGAILGHAIPDSFSYILIAAVLSTPGALAISALMIPYPIDADAEAAIEASADGSAMEAIVRGALEGISLVAAIIAMLIVLVAIVTLVNDVVGLVPLGGAPLSLQRLFAFGFRPLTWLIGIPWEQSGTAALLMGTKTVLNEFVAYLDLAHLPAAALDAHAKLVMTFALCGFANFGSLGIMLGGMTAMAPERRADIVALGWRSLVSGTLASLMSGAVAGLFV
jgi:concentrative nucleoside transporter, CNT family